MIADTFYTEVEYAYKLKEIATIHFVKGKNLNISRELVDIFMFFCNHFEINPSDVSTKKRTAVNVRYRDLFTGFVRTMKKTDGSCRFSLTKIGVILSGRHHSTIITSRDRHKQALEMDSYYRKDFERLLKAWRR